MGQKRVSKYDGNAPHVSRLHGLVLIASASWLHSGSCQAGWGQKSPIADFFFQAMRYGWHVGVYSFTSDQRTTPHDATR